MSLISEIQAKLKAPKGQFNNFGKYKYRSCEDIVEAVKPLLHENGLHLILTDEIVNVGERYYIQATASIIHNYSTDNKADASNAIIATATAYAREPEQKKGMDESQITGTASSYARKYALNGLLAIDDAKDADTDEHANQVDKGEKPWYNDFDKHEDKMVDRIGDGESPEAILESIKSKFRVNKTIEAKILALGKGE